MSLTEALALTLAAAAAGGINAVAGGGTLVTFPTLLFFGVAPMVANATSSLALLLGLGGSLYGFRAHLRQVRPILWRLLPVSIIGGLIGGVLLTLTDSRLFSKLVPFLILLATLLFAFKGFFKKLTEPAADSAHLTAVTALIFQFFVAIYGGYFGAGIGILMLATFAWFGLKHIHEMNALKTVVSGVINLVATSWFVFSGLIDWPRAAVMTVGAVAGYFLGSHYSQKVDAAKIGRFVVLIGFVFSAATFYKEFFRPA